MSRAPLAFASTLLIITGAILCAVALLYDFYFSDSAAKMGAKQMLAIAASCAMMGLGAVLGARAEPAKASQIAQFWMVAVQVAFALGALMLFQIENRVFYHVVAPIIACGFIIHHHLSPGLRKPFFLAVGVGVFIAVFASTNLAAGLWLVGLALALFAILEAPIALWMRIALFVAAGVGFAAMRAGHFETSWSPVILPVLASMFIFRAAIYLYDRANGKGPDNIWQRLSYFFLPPNVVFPFFPVVDFATFGRTYYNDEAARIYQRGVTLILRGLIHLLLYRAVYHHGVLAPEQVSSGVDFMRFIVMNFGLYLRISGMFHLIVGLVMLFGHNLPETHTRFYFSNSFVDFWRRINIYWKEFMQKMVFTPSFVRFNRAGLPHLGAIIAAMMIVFFCTWALHAYQWFWLRGTVLFTPQDMLFWTMLGVFLVVQTLRDAKVKPAPGLLGPQTSLVIRTACTFITICVLWSFWTSESPAIWGELWVNSGLTPAFAAGAAHSPGDWLITIASIGFFVFCLAVTANVGFGVLSPVPAQKRKLAAKETPWRAALVPAAISVGLVAAQFAAHNFRPGSAAAVAWANISEPRLNKHDEARIERGYYENLTDVNQFSSQLWQVYMARPRGLCKITEAPFVRMRHDILPYDLAPGGSGIFNGVMWTINSWGMRDDEIALEKPEGVVRIAVVGPSHATGWGVELTDRFDKVLARSLNADAAAGVRYETLNFAVPAYSISDRIFAFTEQSWAFKPDIILFVSHEVRDLDLNHLAESYVRRAWPDLPFLKDIETRAGLSHSQTERQIRHRLEAIDRDITAAFFNHFAAQARDHGARVVWVAVPMARELELEGDRTPVPMQQLAAEAGFETINLSTIFSGYSTEQLQVASWDFHPNVLGNQLIAAALDRELRALDAAGKLELPLGEDAAR